MNRLVPALLLLTTALSGAAEPSKPPGAALFFDFDEAESPPVRLRHGAKRVEGKFGSALEFNTALQYAEADFSRRLDGVESLTVGGWFFPRRVGEQPFVFRGVPEVAPLGERMFRRRDDWVNFLLGTDQHGFLIDRKSVV